MTRKMWTMATAGAALMVFGLGAGTANAQHSRIEIRFGRPATQPRFVPQFRPTFRPIYQPNFPGRSSGHHIDALALRLERQVKELHREVHRHFRNTAQYRHLDRDVAEMERLARHIHDVAHRGGNRAHLRADLNKLDRTFHHIEELVEDLAHGRRVDRRTIRHLRRELKQIGDTLHHLRHDLH